MSPPVHDTITLRGLRVRGHHGVLPEERRDGQTFVIDVELSVDVRAAAAGDDLTATVDYGVLADRFAEAVSRDPVDLIETLAERLADVCLTDPRVAFVELTVHKPQAPVGLPFTDVAVTVRRPVPAAR